jgi:transposase
VFTLSHVAFVEKRLNEKTCVYIKSRDLGWKYSKCIPQEALRDLDRAYENFFRRVKNGGKPGFPNFKSRKWSKKSFRLTGAIRVEEGRIKLPRIGWLRLKERGYIPTEGEKILSATVSEKAGRWFVSVQCREEIDVSRATGEPIGVDLNVTDMAVCSDGRRFFQPKPRDLMQRLVSSLSRATLVEIRTRRRCGKHFASSSD